jgi:hypothetical protein
MGRCLVKNIVIYIGGYIILWNQKNVFIVVNLRINNMLEERIPVDVVKVGEEISSCLMDASIEKALGGIGGCKKFDLSVFPEKFHDLISAYLDEEINSVEAIYIAMRRRYYLSKIDREFCVKCGANLDAQGYCTKYRH